MDLNQDKEVLKKQLGRAPRNIVEIPVRCSKNFPQVLVTAPLLEDSDNLFPTTFWLSCPELNYRIAKLEDQGFVTKIKKEVPSIALGTDLIVGFPGETEEQFMDTLDLYKKCEFDISYPAKYSERSGTAAAKAFSDDVSNEDKKARWRKVQDLMEQIAFEKNQKYINKEVEVLVDECNDGVCSGRSSEMKLVQFIGNEDMVGSMVKVKIHIADVWLLKGTVD